MEGPRTLTPVEEKEESVSYLGVELPKATRTENAPRKEQYADYVNDAFSLELQKKLAVSFHQGDPVLIEAGTSIGKTTAVRKMCADLGWEVHYVNLNGATDIEDLMGRYIPNRERRASTDPEYVFANGKVTSGLRQEEGKVKVVLLDEYNAAAPNILIRLHEVLDALERGGEVVLAEDASEKIQVDKAKTKVVGLMNPPGRGYLQREPLDPAQIRRWVYLKEASELPAETLSHATRALFGLEGQAETVPESVYLFAGEAALTLEQLAEVPGISETLGLYLEFHAAAKELLAKRAIAADQPQRFLFDDREEPKRVRDFVLSFYRGDISQTVQAALRYYYAGKLLELADKEKLEELIRTVQYVPPQNTKRVAVAAAPAAPAAPGAAPAAPVAGEKTPLADAERIMGKENLLGPAEVKKAFGIEVGDRPIPFSPAELERAKALGQQLIFQIDVLESKKGSAVLVPLTLENLKARFDKSHDGETMWYDQSWYNDEDFFKNGKPTVGWRLTSKEVLPSTLNKNYLEQTDMLAAHLKSEVWKGVTPPKEYAEAIAEFEREKTKIAGLMDSDWQKASQALADLKLNQLCRESPVEAIYRLVLEDRAREKKLLADKYTWTSGRDSDGDLVGVGNFGSGGAYVHRDRPGPRSDYLGVCLSRMK